MASKQKGEAREKSVLHWARSLFSAALYADALSVEPRRAAQEASPATRHGSGAYVCLCLLDHPSPTEHLKQETHESHMSAPPNTHSLYLSHTHTHTALKLGFRPVCFLSVGIIKLGHVDAVGGGPSD